MTFDQLHLIEPLLRALREAQYEVPTPIQEQAIPVLLEGKDVLGSAQTGTGKTCAFAIPILQRLEQAPRSQSGKRNISCLILTPTRELALQIKDSFVQYGKYLKWKTAVIFGGVPQKPQEAVLQAGVDILVATPGRLLDLHSQKLLDFSALNTFVLDEADRMLDMGFIHDVKKVIALLPAQRQTMLFSATMPKEIAELAQTILIQPVRIAVVPVETTVEAIDQKLYFVSKKQKILLLEALLRDKTIASALVFTRTKHGANKVVKDLNLAHIQAEAIHGNKSQNARQAALFKFKNKELRVLVATDIAARGIDIDRLSHVINFDLPEVPETYIHRIGRTGRAGWDGKALSFCSEEELPLLADIQKHIHQEIPLVKNHPYAQAYSMPGVSGKGTVWSATPKKSVSPQKIEPKMYSRHEAKQQNQVHSRPNPSVSATDPKKEIIPSRSHLQSFPKDPTTPSVQNRFVPKTPTYRSPDPKKKNH
jgi:ATP-dependent RNA helicase RhlE